MRIGASQSQWLHYQRSLTSRTATKKNTGNSTAAAYQNTFGSTVRFVAYRRNLLPTYMSAVKISGTARVNRTSHALLITCIAPSRSTHARESGAEPFCHAADVGFCRYERRGQCNRVSRYANEEILVLEGTAHRFIAAPAGRDGIGLQVDGCRETDIANVRHERRAFQIVHRRLEHRLERTGAVEEAFVAIKIQSRQRGRAGERMAGSGVTVEELDGMLRSLHEG